jgi:thymidylate synthase (FAD)
MSPIDPLFRVEVISQTPNPQQVIYAAMHQDYSEEFVYDSRQSWPDESRCGEIIVNRLLAGERGHYGPLEHVLIVLNCGFFPHSTMQQFRTHRLISVDCQSFRYTSGNLIRAAESDSTEIERTFYLRPVGCYTDRQGKKYEYTEQRRGCDLEKCWRAAYDYRAALAEGISEEHARGIIPFDVRQHWVASMNLRSLMHILDMRAKADAQLECQQLCELILPHFRAWVPAIAQWYEQARWKKARLSP